MRHSVRLIHADVMDGLKSLPDESVHCVITSPPYWSLRNYFVKGQIGLEETPEEWTEKMVAVFREVRRVLRKDGTCWVNVGDAYAATSKGTGGDGSTSTLNAKYEDGKFATDGKQHPTMQPHKIDLDRSHLKPKDLIGLPWRFAFALQRDGWFLRSDIIWSKPNPMPESVTDRPTKAHEMVFLLAKAARYFYDADAVREEATYSGKVITLGSKSFSKGQAIGAHKPPSGNALKDTYIVCPGRNLRSVWSIPTYPFPGAHFATFPPKLVERCLRAGSSEKGCCPECGAPWKREVEASGGTIGKGWHDHSKDQSEGQEQIDPETISKIRSGGYKRETVGWKPTCDCGYTTQVPCTVLDPFGGSGTTAIVAVSNARNAILIELNEEYVTMAERRIYDEVGFIAEITRERIAMENE